MQYFNRLEQLLEIEQNEDRKQYQAQIEHHSTAERRSLGLTWYPIAIRGTEINQADYITVELERTTHQDIVHQFRFGSQVALFSNHDPEEDRIVGIVSHISLNTLKINFKTDELPEWSRLGKLGVDLLFDENSYKEMFHALKNAANEAPKNELIQILLGEKPPHFEELQYTFHNPILNGSQNKALENILKAKHLAIVHGPPGTGKTTTIIQAIKALLKQHPEQQILVCAPSNTAVDLLCEKLHDQRVNVVRIGNPSRVNDNTLALTLDYKVAEQESMKDIKRLKKQAQEYKSMAHKYKRNFGKDEREQRKLLFDEAFKIIKEADKIEQYLVENVLENAQVVASTLVGSNQYFVKKTKYHTLIIDEAGQALEPACWIPILKAQKLILAGDHCQLPPTIKSNEAMKELSNSLLEKSIYLHPKSVVLLEEQYRMHTHIMGYSSQVFYQNKLKAHASVATHQLQTDISPLLYIDTAGCGFDEKLDGTSVTNPEEAAFVVKQLEHLVGQLKAHFTPEDFPSIGLLSPYKKQVELLKEYCLNSTLLQSYSSSITINTIDSFQGQERDIMYISMARSNAKGEIGFLSDIRRMNVAMTRAKKSLVIVGDSSTLSNSLFYKNFIEYVEGLEAYKSAWELMGA
ncbi:MAG: AAA domain-containing protein [Bacteroidota bacterium]|nr:AAA domain-containing protein [Bacteroidota bacterium]